MLILPEYHDPLEFYRNIELTRVSLDFEDCFSLSAILDSSHHCDKGTDWKHQVQEFDMNRLQNCLDLRRDLLNGTYEMSPAHKFTIVERGKKRSVKAIHIRDRIVQYVLCKKIYEPILFQIITDDNAACVTGRGMHYSLRGLGEDLKQCEDTFWIYKFDCKKFFNNINHAILKRILYYVIQIVAYLQIFYITIDNDIVNPTNPNKGLELGSPVSQLSGLLILNEVDHAIPKIRGVKGYKRYMDDGIVICESKKVCQEVDKVLRWLLYALDLTLNEDKTFYNRITHPFIFLKRRFEWLGNGEYKVMPRKEQMHRTNRHLMNVINNEDIQNLESVLSSYYGYYKIGSVNLIHKILPEICMNTRVLDDIRYDTKIGKLLYHYIRDNGISISTDPNYEYETNKKYASVLDRIAMINDYDRIVRGGTNVYTPST